MLLNTFLVVWLISNHFARAENMTDTDTLITKCKRLETYTYNYGQFFQFDEQNNTKAELLLKFYIKARNNAHILLSTISTPSNQDPVYEIVIGGGNNTFSDIRRLQRAQAKSTVSTEFLLSPDEYRGFWIQVKVNGVISVGRIDNDLPFMFWNDPEPLAVRYFSFCTWPGVIGNWAYDCPNEEETNITQVEQPLSNFDKLYSDLFTKYSPNDGPVFSQFFIRVHLKIWAVNLNDNKGVLTSNGNMRLEWNDKRLVWEPTKYGNIDKIVSRSLIWKPQLQLTNSINPADPIADLISGTVVKHDGTVIWSPYFQWFTKCNINLKNWPKDTQVCEMYLSSLRHGVNLTGSKVYSSGIISNWEILSITTENVDWVEIVDPVRDCVGNALAIKFTMKRNVSLFQFSFYLMFVALCALMLSSFCVSAFSNVKIIVNGLLILLTSIFLMLMANTIPEFTAETPTLFNSFMILFLMSGLSNWISICLIYVAEKPHTSPPPKSVSAWINKRVFSVVLFLPHDEESIGYGELEEKYEDNLDTDAAAVAAIDGGRRAVVAEILQGNEAEMEENSQQQKNQTPKDWRKVITATEHLCLLLSTIFVAILFSGILISQ